MDLTLKSHSLWATPKARSNTTLEHDRTLSFADPPLPGTNDRDERSFMVDRLKHHLGQVTSFTQPELCQLLLVCRGPKIPDRKYMQLCLERQAMRQSMTLIEIMEDFQVFDDMGDHGRVPSITYSHFDPENSQVLLDTNRSPRI